MSNEFKTVPVVPTEAMLDAALRLQGDDAFQAKAPALMSALLKIYVAMVKAAPSADGEVVYQWREIGEREWREAPTKEYFDNRDSDPICETRILHTSLPTTGEIIYQIRQVKFSRNRGCSGWHDYDFARYLLCKNHDSYECRILNTAPPRVVDVDRAIREMKRYLPVLEMAESVNSLWAELTNGTGIATLNGYKAALEALEQTK